MLEWLKRHAWKACIPQKGISGSNPDLSARNGTAGSVAGCFFVDYADSAGCYTGKYDPYAPGAAFRQEGGGFDKSEFLRLSWPTYFQIANTL